MHAETEQCTSFDNCYLQSVCVALRRETWNRHASTSSNHHKWSHKLFVRWQRIDESEKQRNCARLWQRMNVNTTDQSANGATATEKAKKKQTVSDGSSVRCAVHSLLKSRQSQYRSHWHDSRMWNGLFAHLIRVRALSSYRWPCNWMQMRRVSTDFTFPMQTFRESVIAFETVEPGRLSSAWIVHNFTIARNNRIR